LLKNIKSMLKSADVPCHGFLQKRGRIYIETQEATNTAAKVVRTFGVSSASPATHTTANIDDITQTSVDLANERMASENSFAVRCNRVGEHSYSSLDICKRVGTEILASLKNRNVKVDLTNPDLTINIDVRDGDAFVFAETLQGPGGFPLGSQGKLVALLSGGIDSPVACWLVMKRGCLIVPVYFDNAPYTDKLTLQKAVDTAKTLFDWSTGYPRRLFVIQNGKNLEAFIEEAPRRFTCLLCKRFMYRVAELIAEKEHAEGIVTGEAVGEQASQTLVNLRVLDDAATRYPVHRPLLGFDKVETERIARRIGTLDISTRKAKGCIAAPNQPATQARLERVKEAEARLNIDTMAKETFGAAETITV
jgi:thiamine biosynthesis protein ThiI